MSLSNGGPGIESTSVSEAQAAALLQAANTRDSDVFNIPQLSGIRTPSGSKALSVPSPGKLLEMWILRSQPRPTEPGTEVSLAFCFSTPCT